MANVMCNIAPRRDTDVTIFNNNIHRLVTECKLNRRNLNFLLREEQHTCKSLFCLGWNPFVNVAFEAVIRSGLSWFNRWVSLAPKFQCCYFCESSCLFYLSFNFSFYVSKLKHL